MYVQNIKKEQNHINVGDKQKNKQNKLGNIKYYSSNPSCLLRIKYLKIVFLMSSFMEIFFIFIYPRKLQVHTHPLKLSEKNNTLS